MPTFDVRHFEPADQTQVRNVIAQAFQQTGEAELVDTLRCRSEMLLELVATSSNRIFGHISFSRLSAQSGVESLRACALAPLAVSPESQFSGIGSRLVTIGMDELKSRRIQLLVVLGDPQYYERFGFSVKRAAALATRYSGPHLMAMELEPSCLGNKLWSVTYPSAFTEQETRIVL
ncbi:MAG: N-acetyltransferase [Micropepsaceae bacterium]